MQQAAWRVYGQRSECAVLIVGLDFYSKKVPASLGFILKSGFLIATMMGLDTRVAIDKNAAVTWLIARGNKGTA